MNVKHGRYRAALTHRVRADAPCRSTRRAFLLAAASWPALAWTGAALPQSKQPILIGWLNGGSRELNGHLFAAFKEGLAALGWKEGSQLVIEERWANGRTERLQPLAQELAAKKPAVIVAGPSLAVAAAANAAPKTPIVVATGDPLAAGLVSNLARPGGMITGVTNIVTQVSEKYLELLLAAAPKLRRIGFLVDTTQVVHAIFLDAARRAVAQYSVEARYAEVARPEEFEPALSRLAKEGVQALVVFPSQTFIVERRRIIKLALAHRWPTIGNTAEWADEGALLSYGADSSALYRRTAYYVDRILKGAKPGDLPIEQPTRFELVVNLKTAKAIGRTISQSLLFRADKVIE
jgi:putative ABC transport system substrate-binding protein